MMMSSAVTEQPRSFVTDVSYAPSSWTLSMEPLRKCDRVLLKQRVRCSDVCADCSGCTVVANKYNLHSPLGDVMFTATEKSSLMCRCCCANMRALTLELKDLKGETVLELQRPLNCVECPMNCCYPQCMQEMNVLVKGELIGVVRECPRWFSKAYVLLDDSGTTELMRISGPCWHYACGNDINFFVTDLAEGTGKATISKKWLGWCRESFLDEDNFEIVFQDKSMGIREKALIVAATFLIDFNYYEVGAG